MNIIVCFGKSNDVNTIRNLLGHYGLHVAFSCMSGVLALEACEKLSSGLLISGYRLSDMVCGELYENMPRSFSMLVMCAPNNWESVPAPGMEVLDMPVKASLIIARVQEMIAQMEAEKRARRQRSRLGTAGRSQAENELIARAKRRLMEQRGYDEPHAHRYLQDMAMRSGDSLAETAQKYIGLAENARDVSAEKGASA